MKRLAVAACLLLITSAASAQEPPLAERDLPPDVRDRLLRITDSPDAARFDGPDRVAAGRTVPGDAVAVGGPFTVAGRIDGALAVVDGSLTFEPGASVGGDVIVIGGTAAGVDNVEIGGALTVYSREFRGTSRGRPADRARRWRGRGPAFEFGGSRFALHTGASYNRVEGLPVRFGPVIETAGDDPTRARALGIWRTESGTALDGDDLGYDIRLEQFVGGRRTLLVGAGLHSVIEPIEDWRVRHLEASLATGLLHADPRDHRERTGWSVFTRFRPRAAPLDASLELRRDDHRPVAAGDPFSVFRGDAPWRLQPLAAAGELASLRGRVVLDARDDEDDPTRGWYVDLAGQQGLGGDLIRPALAPPDGTPADRAPFAAVDYAEDFTRAFVDIRRYARAAPGSLLGMRVVAGGAVTGAALPPQLQHALGGAGSLPGHDRFAVDCGARDAGGRGTAGAPDGARFVPFYGCDRVALLQVEYIGGFGLDLDFGWNRPEDARRRARHGAGAGEADRDHERDRWDWRGFDWSPAWVAFADAGRGWATEEARALGARDSRALYDAGVGLLFGDLGIYAALPLNGEDDAGPNLIVRLGRRF